MVTRLRTNDACDRGTIAETLSHGAGLVFTSWVEFGVLSPADAAVSFALRVCYQTIPTRSGGACGLAKIRHLYHLWT